MSKISLSRTIKALQATTLLSTVFILATPIATFIPSVSAQEVKQSRVLTVTGQGERYVPTTTARVQVAVAVEGKTAEEVQAEIARKTNRVIATLKELQVDKLQTTGISLSPKYVYENNRQRQDGFTGQNSISFVTSIERSGATLDAIVAAGANRIDQISFLAPDEAVRVARNGALQDAVKDAQAQADAVLSSLNLKAQSIRTIQIGNAQSYTPQVFKQALSTADNNATSVVGGVQNVQASVTLEITY
ncbi:SIMPL domain-containing protein [Tumidithrix elongata RA019]|uniref:SIMPL domain-containing protein n=1 Tax=Tumidithrix elongata BACA0141 TaxID=2716417 RepID=A0AAW9Q4Z7_9CYAN|nr:SIMPL domain-containing protein [Tumidithrix elongata RA019]